MSSNSVIESGLKQVNLSGRVAKGFNCVVKAIVKGKAQVVFLADDVDNKDYKALIPALCRQHGVRLEGGLTKQTLGDVLGMASIKGDGETVRRHICCGACAVMKFGGPTQATDEFRAALGMTQE